MEKNIIIPTSDIYTSFMADHLGLNELADLDHLTKLKKVSVISSRLKTLPKFPDGLEYLDITSNPLTKLDLPPNIKELHMYDTFDEIPELPITLKTLSIGSFEKMTPLNYLTNLEILYITEAKTKILELPPNLKQLRIDYTEFKYLPDNINDNCCIIFNYHAEGCQEDCSIDDDYW